MKNIDESVILDEVNEMLQDEEGSFALIRGKVNNNGSISVSTMSANLNPHRALMMISGLVDHVRNMGVKCACQFCKVSMPVVDSVDAAAKAALNRLDQDAMLH